MVRQSQLDMINNEPNKNGPVTHYSNYEVTALSCTQKKALQDSLYRVKCAQKQLISRFSFWQSMQLCSQKNLSLLRSSEIERGSHYFWWHFKCIGASKLGPIFSALISISYWFILTSYKSKTNCENQISSTWQQK